MKKPNPTKSRILWFASLVLIFSSLFSCTYDYFVDETNYYLYLPQVKEQQITDLTVVLFDMSGKSRFTRQYTKKDFEADPNLSDGIIKVRILPGDYTISCFSGAKHTFTFDPELSVELDNSLDASFVSLFTAENQRYTTCPPNFKTIRGGMRQIKAPFLGQIYESDGVTPVRNTDTLYVDQYNGTIHVLIDGLDRTKYDRFEMIVNGLSTRWKMDCTPANFGAGDQVIAKTKSSETTGTGNQIEFSHPYFPSSTGKDLSVVLYFVDTNNVPQELIISEDDFRDISNGNVTRLDSQDDIYITIKNLIVTHISLEGWDPNINTTNPGGGGEM